ncbi:uncharacterized protein [Bemisia tabaci]|uniref:uncharacterized protein n=1 Tax=Bemisia tabaci TaxID=7038 RepID=UPI003B28ACDD
MSVVDKPRIISAEVKKRNNYLKRDFKRPHIAGELWVLTDACSEKKIRYVEVRDGQLLVFPAFSSRRLPEWRLPLYDLNLLPYPLGNPFCFSFSRRDHSTPVAIFQAQNADDYERWVRTLAAELICQTPFDHVRFLDILGITATLHQHRQQQQQQQLHIAEEPQLPGHDPEKSTLLKEKQQNMLNTVVQSSFVKNCLRFKTNAHRKYESHRKNKVQERIAPESDSEKENADENSRVRSRETENISKRVPELRDVTDGYGPRVLELRDVTDGCEPRVLEFHSERRYSEQDSRARSPFRVSESDSEKETEAPSRDLTRLDSESAESTTDTRTESDSERESRLEFDGKKRDNRLQTKKLQTSYLHSFYRKMKSSFSDDPKSDSVSGTFRRLPESQPLPDVVNNLPKVTYKRHSDLKPNSSCPNLRPAPKTKNLRKALSSCSECDSDDSSSGFRFQAVSTLLARCQESVDYVPVKDKLMLFESLCEPQDSGLNKLKSRSLHDLGRAQDEQFELDVRKCPYHSSTSNLSYRLKQDSKKGSSSNLVRNICRYFEHRTSGQVANALWWRGSQESEEESIGRSQSSESRTSVSLQGSCNREEKL